tara:strand:- start:195 stop:1496 length:1302 start_codon:yes stop_codon:yes gene_type:complete
MAININNFFSNNNKVSTIGDFQDIEHVDGVAISSISANLYSSKRDDLVLFYFRNGANHASVYTQSKIVSENIKWNLKINEKKIKGILINTRNANAFTGKQGYQSIKEIAEILSEKLTEKQKKDEDDPEKIKPKDLLFASTGTIGEEFPKEKIKSSLNELIEKIKYTQNKYIWMKAAMGILTTDLKPKISIEECKIGNSNVKIYGIAKGSGMIFPNMATTLGFIFTDANLSSAILKELLKKNITDTFNAITCDGDTSTNDMVSIFATSKAKNPKIKSISDKKLSEFEKSLKSVLLNLAKRVVSDGEGASKFIKIKCINCKSKEDAKKISFSIANSPLVKTAFAGEDPNWGRLVMAIGKANVRLNLKNLNIKIGNYKVVEKGEKSNSYNEEDLKKYMRDEKIDLIIDLGLGKDNFTAYTMDLTKKYVEINADYRT